MKVKDNINPFHYQLSEGKQVFDYVIEICKELPGSHAVCASQALQYISRYHKKNGAEDIQKAIWYLNKLLEIIKLQEEVKWVTV